MKYFIDYSENKLVNLEASSNLGGAFLYKVTRFSGKNKIFLSFLKYIIIMHTSIDSFLQESICGNCIESIKSF